MPQTWPDDWAARRAGQDCPKCAEGRPGQDPWGVRFFAGRWADAYLKRQPPQPGAAFTVPAVVRSAASLPGVLISITPALTISTGGRACVISAAGAAEIIS